MNYFPKKLNTGSKTRLGLREALDYVIFK